jgi:osmotically-inducible protein OsmY
MLAETPQTIDLTNSFRGANAAVNSLQVYEIAGIVIIRGRTADKAQAEVLSNYARELGYQRVANLVQIATNDDAAITRKAEVELSVHRALDGCRFHVRSNQGVVHVNGQVRHELQKDVAMQVIRSINGVRRIEMDLVKF